MPATIRLKKMFADLYNGQPWSCINLIDQLKDITAEQAAKHPIQNANSIWQLVQHCVGWKQHILQKLNNSSIQAPDDNYLAEPEDFTTTSWQLLLQKMQQTENDWQQFLSNMGDEVLDQPYLPSEGEFTIYEVLQGLLHHDNYHYGQIVILKKLL